MFAQKQTQTANSAKSGGSKDGGGGGGSIGGGGSGGGGWLGDVVDVVDGKRQLNSLPNA